MTLFICRLVFSSLCLSHDSPSPPKKKAPFSAFPAAAALHNTQTKKKKKVLSDLKLESIRHQKHAAWHHTSADWSREIPHGRVAGVGDARERGVAVQHVAGDAAVLHAVAHRKAVAAAQDGLSRNAGITARRAVELCRQEGEEVERG